MGQLEEDFLSSPFSSDSNNNKKIEDSSSDVQLNKAGETLRAVRLFLSAKKRFPIIKEFKNYSGSKLFRDFVAGLTVALISVPQNMAVADIANVDAEYPLYSAIIGNFVYAVCGTSKDLNVGPTSAVALLILAYSNMGRPEYSRILALWTGVVEIFLGLFHMSNLINYVSATVLGGFISATSMAILLGQMKTLFGNSKIKSSNVSVQIYELMVNIDKSKWCDFFMGAGCVAFLLGSKVLGSKNLFQNSSCKWKKFIAKMIWLTNLLSNLIVVIGAAGIAHLLSPYFNFTFSATLNPESVQFDLSPFKIIDSETGQAIPYEQIFSDIYTGLFTLPIFAILFSIAVAKTYGRLNGYRIDATQEFLAFGLVNLTSSVCNCMPAAASTSRTAINAQCNVATLVSSLFSSSMLLIILLFATSPFKYIPKASLASIIVASVFFNIDFSILRDTLRVQKSEFFVALVTMVFTLVCSPEFGLIAGILVTLLISLYPSSKSKPEMRMFQNGQLLIIRFDQGLHFASNETMLDFFYGILDDCKNNENRLELCVVDLESLWKIDYLSAVTFASLKKSYRKLGISMFFIRPRPLVLEFLLRASGDKFPRDWHIFPNLKSALQEFSAQKAVTNSINMFSDQDKVDTEVPSYGSIEPCTKISK